jgi:mannosyltransferase OCH1-like enzyme
MTPKIIHQIWEGRKDPILEQYKQFASTWKENHPDWRYEHWDGDKINAFYEKNYCPYFYRSQLCLWILK